MAKIVPLCPRGQDKTVSEADLRSFFVDILQAAAFELATRASKKQKIVSLAKIETVRLIQKKSEDLGLPLRKPERDFSVVPPQLGSAWSKMVSHMFEKDNKIGLQYAKEALIAVPPTTSFGRQVMEQFDKMQGACDSEAEQRRPATAREIASQTYFQG